MREERSITQGHEDRAYLHQGLQNLLTADDPNEIEFLGRLLRIWSHAGCSLTEAAALAVEGRSMLTPGDEKPLPASEEFLRLMQAAAVADSQQIASATQALADATGTPHDSKPIPQAEIGRLCAFYDAEMAADRALELLALSILERLEGGAPVETGERQVTFESTDKGQLLTVDGQDIYHNFYRPGSAERRQHRAGTDESTADGRLRIL